MFSSRTESRQDGHTKHAFSYQCSEFRFSASVECPRPLHYLLAGSPIPLLIQPGFTEVLGEIFALCQSTLACFWSLSPVWSLPDVEAHARRSLLVKKRKEKRELCKQVASRDSCLGSEPRESEWKLQSPSLYRQGCRLLLFLLSPCVRLPPDKAEHSAVLQGSVESSLFLHTCLTSADGDS